MGTLSFIFLRGKLLYFFLGLCDYSDKFPKTFCSSCCMECPSTANFCHQCGQQLTLSQVSKKAATSVDKEKLLKNYFHIITLGAGYFIINFSRMYLRDRIFPVLLGHFIHEVVRN